MAKYETQDLLCDEGPLLRVRWAIQKPVAGSLRRESERCQLPSRWPGQSSGALLNAISTRGDAPFYVHRPGRDAADLAPVPTSTAAEKLNRGRMS